MRIKIEIVGDVCSIDIQKDELVSVHGPDPADAVRLTLEEPSRIDAAAPILRAKLPIDRPCSACSAGDHKMEHHDHDPPFRVRRDAVAKIEWDPVPSRAELVDRVGDF